MVRVRSINRDAAHETRWLRGGVDSGKHNAIRICDICIRAYEDAASPQPSPERAGVTRRPADANDVLSGCFVGAERCAAQVLTDGYPVTTVAREYHIARKQVTVLIEKGLTTTIVLRPPDVLRAQEPRAAYLRVPVHWDIERHVLATKGRRIPYPVIGQLVSAVKVDVNLHEPWSGEESLRPNVGIADINPPVSTVAKDGDKPVAVAFPVALALRTERLRPVVLRPALDIGPRSLRVNREALELKRSQTAIYRRDRCRNLRQPMLAINQVCPADTTRRAPG